MHGNDLPASGTGQRQRILVVDDDQSQRTHAGMVLRAAGLEVFEAGSGEQALELLGRDRVDAVLLDIRMPGMDGFETCSRIRELRRGEFLPIIVATGLDDMEAVRAAYHAGATDFVVKPINWTILTHRIRYTVNARAMAEELAASAGHRRGLMGTIPDAVLSLDREGRVKAMRLPSAQWGVGSALFAVGQQLPDALPQPAAGVARAAIEALRKGANQTSFEFEVDVGGEAGSYDVYLALGGPGETVALVRDFTERRRAESEIRRLAYIDRVTGLANRERLLQFAEERMQGAVPSEGPLAFLRIELEGLDYTRSLLGNRHAEELLGLCAKRLCRLVDQSRLGPGRGAHLVGRVSDAGFAVIRDDLPGLPALEAFAEYVHEQVAGSYTLGDYEINVTARLGVAVQEKCCGADAAQFLDQAEMAIGQAQSTPAFYSRRTSDQRRERARLVRELQVAVSNGDLHLEYQPKVDSVNRRLLGVEALARWDHPSGEPVPPARFIPLAEESGLILPIGEFVLDEACRQSREWHRAGYRVVPIAVNFSGHQFSKRGLVQAVMGTLASHGIGDGEIEIELTESVAMEHCNGISQVLQELHEIGIRTAVDDFGTGYSSLSNLRQFQFHTLKIDRSFVADIDANPSSRSIIRGIIGMSHGLGMKVVAEGVEKDDQLDYLREQGCDLIQGYLTGRPVRAAGIERQLPCHGTA